jgi:hypothetical protein
VSSDNKGGIHWAALLVATGAVLCPALGRGQNERATYSGPVFEDIGGRSGLKVPHISTWDKRYIIESMSGGVGFMDCDNDGRLDIVTVNGSNIDRYRAGGDPMVTLYHQEPEGTFKDVTSSAGLTRRGWGMGVAVADFDNDGRLDLYTTGYGGNVLYHNLVTANSKTSPGKRACSAVASAPARPGRTTTATATLICSSLATSM